MRIPTIVLILSAAAYSGVSAQDVPTGKLGNATFVTNNPVGASYIATLPDNAFFKDAFPDGGNIEGTVQAVSSPSGEGVIFQISLSNLPSEGGPFLFHIHDQPVPEDGNCTKTLAHLDPFQRGEDPACDATLPETCQVGDLAGKYGTIGSNPFNATFTDRFASTVSGIGAFFGNRSIAVHFANKTRITCANFTFIEDDDPDYGSDSDSDYCSASTTEHKKTSTSTATTRRSTKTASSARDNSTITGSASSPRMTVVTAAGYTHLPSMLLGFGAAVLAFIL